MNAIQQRAAHGMFSARPDGVRFAESARPSLLPQIVGFFFAFRLFFVLLAARVLGQEAQAGVGAELVFNYLLLLMAGFYSLGTGSRTLLSMTRVPCMRWVLMFLGVAGGSLFWTGAASVSAAAAFWLAMVADTAIVVLLLRTSGANAVVNGIMKGFVWGASTVAAIAWLLPSQSDLRLGDERLLGPNQIGYLSAFAFFFAQYLMQFDRQHSSGQKSGLWSLHATLLGLTMLRSLSKTTIIAFVIAEGYILLRDRSMSRGRKRALALAALLAIVVFSSLLAKYYDVYTNAGNQSETLTGRLGIWAYFVSEAVEKPWIGHGFHSVWKVVPPFGPDQFEARHAHNELLQQFYAYGVIGVAMTAAIYFSLYRNLRAMRGGPVKVLFFGMLVFVLVRGLADTEPFDLSLPMWTIVMIGCVIELSRGSSEVFA